MTTAINYTILAGDTLSGIATALDAAAGVSYQVIEQANPTIAPSDLQAGMVLQIPARNNSSTIVLKYTVLTGDSYFGIANGLSNCANVTYQQIEQANPGVNPNVLAIGQVIAIPNTNSAPAPTPTPTPTPASGTITGFWWWTWSSNPTPPAGVNLSIAFSGWANPQTALQNSANIQNSLPGIKYICMGGGNSNGAWTVAAVNAVTSAINAGSFAGYNGIAYDIEEGSAGLESAFQQSFAAAKAKGFQVLVTVSHSAPYGVSDAATLMQSFFANPNIDILSPQLYTTGEETSNQYTTSGGVTWAQYATAKAAIAPSIVSANLYASAQTYFKEQGVTLNGFVQWSQSA
jgi:LysM repeat protein